MIEKKRGFLKKICDIANPYSWITTTRNRLFDCGLIKSHIFSIPTICIGNISVGGTGKTPHTEYLVRLLKEKFHTAVLSRGYGRKSKGYILAQENTPMSIIGDEPFQIKSKFKHDINVAVCEKRVIGIEKLTKDAEETEVILLDDAFQHRHVKAGLNILLIDSSHPIWQDCILPFGRMRESENGIRRADIAIITKCKNLTDEEKNFCRNHIKKIKDIPVFFSRMRYGELYPLFGCYKKEISQETDVLLVTGIARPEPLITPYGCAFSLAKAIRSIETLNAFLYSFGQWTEFGFGFLNEFFYCQAEISSLQTDESSQYPVVGKQLQ